MPSTTEERDEILCRRYVSERISTVQLGIDFGLSEIRVRQILKSRNVSVKDRAPGLAEGDRVVSPLHLKLGKKLLTHRSLELGVDRPFLGKKLGWSSQKIASIERGTFNMTILDLNDLAKLFETTPPRLLEVTTTSLEVDSGDPKGSPP